MTKSEWMAKNPDRQAEYKKYISSAKWKKLRKEVMALAKFTCQRCRKYACSEVHHLNYDRFRNERLSDLQALCRSCHDEADEERVQKQEADFEAYCEERLEDAQLRGWVRKVYGEDADIDQDKCEEFLEWKQGKDEEENYY